MKRYTPLAAVILLLAPVLTADAASLSGRVTRLENIVDNQRGSDMLLEIQRLQQEVQQLRGLAEQQRFELDRLWRQQQDQYLDLDTRLRALGGGGPTIPQAPTDGAAPATPGGLVSTTNTPPAPGVPADAMAPAGQVTEATAPTKQATEATATAGQTTETTAPSERPAEAGVPEVQEPANPAAPGPETTTPPISEREAYRSALALLKKRQYDEAATAFGDLLEAHPRGEFADSARYWLGEAHYVKQDLLAAIIEFQQVLDDHPQSPKVAGAMLKIGYIQDEQQDWPAARATLEELIRRFPQRTEARRARKRLEQMAQNGH